MKNCTCRACKRTEHLLQDIQIKMTDQRENITKFGSWIDRCLVSFRTERCLFSSNWPVGHLVSPYDAIMFIYRRSLAVLSTDDQAAICSKNAKQLYGFNKTTSTTRSDRRILSGEHNPL
ncbi:MAG: hypothetical protein B5766_08560 [Candidatus Lumbricidophila eiseniae]|uniref:Amidohydrolase-related domain-containing protein n=1 Tax=Candidatus Lumbricidiphila eiseniae TaxID=1969409 RepID=A0A2A6FQ71_9MICO|nr:MAG: hypothetical protein B5766_08560 [Candidatus Lumbricidophila eiseniae]